MIYKTTEYTGLKKNYFDKILKEIIKISDLKRDIKILDFGCGEKRLEKLLGKKIYNYDIKPEYSDLKKYDETKYDIVIFNQILMYLDVNQQIELFSKLYSLNPKMEFVIGESRKNLLSKIMAYINFEFNAHKGTKISFKNQEKFIIENFDLIKKKNKNLSNYRLILF